MEQLIQIIKKAQEQERLFFLGARSSQGMNTFVIKDITAVSRISESNAVRYLNLGMLLPDKIDFNKSYLKIFTSERRPFHMPGGWEKDVCGQVVSFIQQGSIILGTLGRHANVYSQFSMRMQFFLATHLCFL